MEKKENKGTLGETVTFEVLNREEGGLVSGGIGLEDEEVQHHSNF